MPLFLCKPIFLKQKRKFKIGGPTLHSGLPAHGVELVLSVIYKKNSLHILTLINIEKYKTKQNDRCKYKMYNQVETELINPLNNYSSFWPANT